ncbi:hypothetical protein LCGC14_0121520 [marine sediment metagenome]|uniref:Uncharacterized protein n=1 Tax=marine sediment metagenome TaxID=412755 RepID=A0A0F9XP43_9ZZZZ|nr:hypothetical protein [Halomonas sp.]HDZ46747.1 hypothetical protein [Halomonas sp.]HEB03214.1 hypothetical protein [Halomonas sp.]
MKTTQAITITAFTVLLAACSQEMEPEQVESHNTGDHTAQEHDLSALSEDDMRNASLQGELGCSFTTNSESVLLVAMGVVASSDPAEGLVKVDNELRQVSAPGGFDGMWRGATFEGDGHSIQITVTGEAEGSGESPPYPADITLEGTDQSAISGRWTCGP